MRSTARRQPRERSARWIAVVARLAFMPAVAVLLAAGIVGGLLRAGVSVPMVEPHVWPGHAVLAHAFVMISGFLGTVIGIERAVAAKARWAFAAPAASAAAGLAALSGASVPAAGLAVLAALAFVAVNARMLQRQRAPHIGVLLAGACAWLVGNLLYAWAGAAPRAAAVPWWFAFLILTIAGERLEMTRLLPRRAGATAALHGILGALLAGSALFALAPAVGALVFGAALIALAAWLISFDIARRTLAASGLPRYMAVCLLTGYGWLGLAGAAWIGTAAGLPWRDAALHALGLGFVFSMILAHAPVILPALVRVKLAFGWTFYVPLALLHASLALRLAGPWRFELLSAGALGNAAAIAAFAITMLMAALAWRMKHPTPDDHAVAAHH